MQDDRDRGDPVYHNRCKDVAFYWVKGFFPVQYDLMVPHSQMVHKSGRAIMEGELVECDSCGRGFGLQFDFENKICVAVS